MFFLCNPVLFLRVSHHIWNSLHLFFHKRKKEFILQDVKERKERGEKGFLKILAKEKFEDMIVAENIEKAEETSGSEN